MDFEVKARQDLIEKYKKIENKERENKLKVSGLTNFLSDENLKVVEFKP